MTYTLLHDPATVPPSSSRFPFCRVLNHGAPHGIFM